jgi:hypothetical protein
MMCSSLWDLYALKQILSTCHNAGQLLWVHVGSWAYDEPSVPKSEVSAFVEDIGKMGWLAGKSRPEIALAVNKLQRRTLAPRQEDINTIKQLIRYLKGTMNLGILLGKASDGPVATSMLHTRTVKTARTQKLKFSSMRDHQSVVIPGKKKSWLEAALQPNTSH